MGGKFPGVKLPILIVGATIGSNTVIPRYNAPRYNADLAITRFFTPKVFLPHLLRKGKFSAKLVDISLQFWLKCSNSQ